MSEYATGYMSLGNCDDEDPPPQEHQDVMIHFVPENGKAHTWNHIENLDEFFARVYHYHQRHGFGCMLLEDVLQLLQFMFVVLFSVFLIECVEYDILFDNFFHNTTVIGHHHKTTIAESVKPLDQCADNLDPIIVICLLVAVVFWVLRVIKVVYNVFKYWEIRSFYISALKISASELPNMTWHDVQRKLLEVQKEHQMCIHKQELSELDIYHRILRFKNYEVAMINKNLIPLTYRVPFVGDYVFLSTALKYNLEMILFWGPWAPFENYWHLKPDFKNHHKRKELAEHLSTRILWIGLANLCLCPVIFIWQIFYSFFRYAEIIKRHPGSLGARRWSLYGRLYLRHFNELDHEFEARLNRGYKSASQYMSIFTSPYVVVVAKNIAFFAGSILAVLVILTVIDEDTLQVEHVLTTMTLLGAIVAMCRALIPDEHMVFCPETLMCAILGQVHYTRDDWRGNAHTTRVRNEFSQLFQYKAVYLLEELFSPIITPLILICSVRHKALDIVDFFHNFTVDVVGVGDVCSFAEMNIKKHGNPQWVRDSQTEADCYHQAEDGKTELSLMHFTLTNPNWKPPRDCSLFLNDVKTQAHQDANTLSVMPTDNPLLSSLHAIGTGYNSIISTQQSAMPSPYQSQRPLATSITPPTQVVRGGVSRAEGPLQGSDKGILSSLHTSGALVTSIGSGTTGSGSPSLDSHYNSAETPIELSATEMSFNALYLHELHRRRKQQFAPHSLNLDVLHSRTHSDIEGSHMPQIFESPQEEATTEEEMSNDNLQLSLPGDFKLDPNIPKSS